MSLLKLNNLNVMFTFKYANYIQIVNTNKVLSKIFDYKVVLCHQQTCYSSLYWNVIGTCHSKYLSDIEIVC